MMVAAEQQNQIDDRRKIQLPEAWLEKEGLNPGDTVILVETDNGILVMSRKARINQLLDNLGEGLKAAGVTTFEDMLELIEETRQEMYDETYGSTTDSDT